jgi:hypothetical protein
MDLLFCNIGWMERYAGLKGRPDKIVGGGSFVNDNGYGAEVCNFLPANDGYVYGHVETIQDENDRRIDLSRLGAENDAEQVDKVTVVWTATHPDEGGRRVVGWFRNATVFRERQKLKTYPSPQHRKDKIKQYRVRAKASDVWLLPVEDRTLRMGRGKGWMGQTPWWVPPDKPSDEIGRFLEKVAELLNGRFVEDDTAQGSIVERGSFRLHLQRERNPTAACAAKEHHGLKCQACEFDFEEFYGELGNGFIEAHHLHPLALLKAGEDYNYNVAADFAVLCSNCHRMIHRTNDPSDLEAFRTLLTLTKQRRNAECG